MNIPLVIKLRTNLSHSASFLSLAAVLGPADITVYSGPQPYSLPLPSF